MNSCKENLTEKFPDLLELFISTEGNDSWSGRLTAPDAAGKDGPLATISGAVAVMRKLRSSGAYNGSVAIRFREGRYELHALLELGPADSNTTFSAYGDEPVVIDGGRRIKGWKPEKVNGTDAWVSVIPEAAEGKWYFMQLFVNGSRRFRSRMPKKGCYRMQSVPGIRKETTLWEEEAFDRSKSTDTFRCYPGDFKQWKDITDIIVVAPHIWTSEIMPVVSFDGTTNTVKSSHKSTFVLKDEACRDYAKYYLDNVFEEMCGPGEWYLDRTTGKLYYIPMPGEDIDTTEAYAPYACQLIRLEGDPAGGRHVEQVHFRNITFRHCDWQIPDNNSRKYPEDTLKYASSGQGANCLPGVVTLKGSRGCSVENCKIEHIGYYAVDILEGCSGIALMDNTIHDMGGGGIKMNGADYKGPACMRTGGNVITGNHIFDGGHVFIDGMGILSKHSFNNDISHNCIHDLYQTGISCGWVWGFGDSISKDNRIEKNHIYNIGKGMSSDMGGIYTLGVQPGTVIRGNFVHDVKCFHYGAGGIYLDEGSSHIVVENNICCNISDQGFLLHIGRENIVRNNIFAFCRQGHIVVHKSGGFNAMSFERNIVFTDDNHVFVHGYADTLNRRIFISDLNLFWDVKGGIFSSGTARVQMEEGKNHPTYDFDQFRELGYDRHSIIEDPGFADIHNFDFTLKEDSPAFKTGFMPIDISDAGPGCKA